MTESAASSGETGRRAVFLDRDGTINREVEYLHREEEFEWIPGAPEAIARLNRAGFLVIVVTNQAGVAHGLYTEDDVDSLHRFITSELEKAGARIDAYYYCPHHPDAAIETYRQNSSRRKPAPGMLLEAAEEYAIDLAGSFLVGDKLIDVEAALAVGATPVLVETGYGSEARAAGLAPVVVANVTQAVDWILSHEV